MSIEHQSSSALFKRAEQLRRWEDSETNREPSVPKNNSRKIKFSSACVFLAACAANDKDEVLRLIQKGADIDTANVDGLTALHQACIDDNLDMVDFLVEHGADVNRGDNEGWTPLHATASCGFLSIAKYLLENGADVAAVNNDGDLAVDIAECDTMEELLQNEINQRGINCEEARRAEERKMLQDAKDFLSGKNSNAVTPHYKTGAIALHVAAAKGYTDVINIILKSDNIDVDIQDIDGWTPLHAAAHWGQIEAAKLLVDHAADLDMKNYVGQTPFDVADTNIFRYLEELKEKQSSQNKELIISKRQAKRRTENKTEAPSKIKKLDLENEKDREDENENVEKKNRVNANISTLPEIKRITPPYSPDHNNKAIPEPPSTPPKAINENNVEDVGALPSWRRPASFRSRLGNESPTKSLSLRIGEKEPKSPTSPTSRNNAESEVSLRRTQSFESDDKIPSQRKEAVEDVTSTITPTTTTNTSITTSVAPSSTVTTNSTSSSPSKTSTSSPSSSPQPLSHVRRVTQKPPVSGVVSPPTMTVTLSTPPTPTANDAAATPTMTSTNKLSPGNIFKNFFKSFVPPVRDEESETQRKAHAKRVRETRRSTQGVTLDEIKSAEQLVKKKNQPTNSTNSTDQFKLEDASTAAGNPTVFVRRTVGSGPPTTRPSSAPVENTTPPAEASVTIPLRRPVKLSDDKEQDKENDIRNAQATQAVIQRRRRPKRRSTGVVHIDMDEIDPDKQDSNGGGDYDNNCAKLNHQDSDTEKGSTRSINRLGGDAQSPEENGELIDYKRLWEQEQLENKRLRDELRKRDELLETRKSLEKISVTSASNRSSLTEVEKREKRAMERKLSEMEEELKQLQKLKAENERLRAENRALTRVVSKLTTVPKANK